MTRDCNAKTGLRNVFQLGVAATLAMDMEASFLKSSNDLSRGERGQALRHSLYGDGKCLLDWRLLRRIVLERQWFTVLHETFEVAA